MGKVSRRQLLPVSPTTENRRTAGQSDCNSPNRHLANSQKKSIRRKQGKGSLAPIPFLCFSLIWTPCPQVYNANGTEERQLTRFQPFARHIRSIFNAYLARFSLECVPIRAA